jgi:hypothetical protein
MSVEMDAEAQAMVKIFKDWDKFNDKFAKNMGKAMVRNQNHSPLQNRFQRSANGNRVYRALKKTTKILKARNGEKYVMQSSGDTKRAVKRTTAGTMEGGKLVFKANVPKYAQAHNDTTDGSKRLAFYSLNDKNGVPIPAEVQNFERVGERVFKNTLSEFGIKGV